MQKSENIKKIVLAYSGGLDTSIIIPWLKEHYGDAEIVTMCTDVGQRDDAVKMEAKALASGASKFFMINVEEELVRDYLFPMLRAGALYEGKYYLGTSIARPLQAKHQVEVALREGADAVAHGCTGKGNDQVRFELTYKALAPHLKVIAPWRIWDIHSREQAIDYAREHNINIGDISKKNIYSRDQNLWHISHEGGDLENPANRPQEDLFKLTTSPQAAPDKETEVSIEFEQAIPVAVNGKKMGPVELLTTLNKLAAANGIGRTDLVETRVVGMKSRGVYETPGGTILYTALKELEMLNLDSESLSMKHTLAIRYAELVYQGKWFSTLRTSLDAFMQTLARYLSGEVKLVLYKGNLIVAARRSPYSLYSEDLASFGVSTYDHKDATGFINLYSLSTGVSGAVHRKDSSK